MKKLLYYIILYENKRNEVINNIKIEKISILYIYIYTTTNTCFRQ